MTEHLWTGAEAPLEYIELLLCRDVYHCPPSQLPPWRIVKEHMAMMQAEQRVRERQKARKK